MKSELRALVSENDVTDLLFKRFSHVNYHSLRKMSNAGLVDGLPILNKPNKLCQVYQFGKQSRKQFPKQRSWNAKYKLGLVHTDLCGPMKTPLLSPSRYYIVFIDDLTRFSWVYFKKQKLEAMGKFIRLKALTETHADRKIKTLRIDNGSKYTSSEFEKFLAQLGVEHQLIVNYTPHQNGVSKRKNRTLVKMARCLLFQSDMSRVF